MEVFVLVLLLRSGIALDYGTYPTLEKCIQAARAHLLGQISEREFRCEKRPK